MIYMCFQLELPFFGNMEETRQQILHEELDFEKNLKWTEMCKWHHVSDEAIDFMKKGLSKNMDDRPTALQML